MNVERILVCFRHPNLQDRVLKAGGSAMMLRGETRWKGEKDELECFKKNFLIMKRIAEEATNNEISSENKELMLSSNLLQQVDIELEILTPICKTIDKAQSRNGLLAESIEDWTNLQTPNTQSIKNKMKKKDKLVFSEASILSNFLHHQFKGASLKLQHNAMADEVIRKMLRRTNEYEAFHRFKKSDAEFDDETLMN